MKGVGTLLFWICDPDGRSGTDTGFLPPYVPGFSHNDFQGWRTSIADAQFALGERNNPPDELHSEMGAACVPACVKCKPSCLKQAFQLVLSTN